MKSKYEIRFFWPVGQGPEVSDFQRLFFDQNVCEHKVTQDKYIIGGNKYNIKVRENELHVKEHIENINSVDHFKKKKRLEFPIKTQKLDKIIGVPLFPDVLLCNSPEELIKKLSSCSQIRYVEVVKERFIRKLPQGTKIEIARIKVRGKDWTTLCIESKSLETLLALSLLVPQGGAESLSYNEFLRKYG
jgi:hypothetical protein